MTISSLTSALSTTISGLQAAQAQISVISNNIANVQTPGYSRQVLPVSAQVAGSSGNGVTLGVTTREVNDSLNRALQSQNSTTSAASTLNDYFQQVQNLMGQVGSSNTLGDTFSKFSSALQTLATTPEDTTAQANAVSAGQQLAQQLNSMSSGIQTLRASADSDIGTAVTQLNTSLQQIASLNKQITAAQSQNQSIATLSDQRDAALNQVSKLINVQTFTQSNGSLVVMTPSGLPLVDTTAQQVQFTQSGQVSATSALSSLTVGGTDITSQVTSGQIGALLQMRDTELPNLTAELNQFTVQLYNTTTASTLATTNSGLVPSVDDSNHFFSGVDPTAPSPALTPPATQDNAAALQVNPSLVSQVSLLNGNVANGNATVANDIAATVVTSPTFATAGNLQSLTTTFNDYAGQILSQNSSAAARASDNSTVQTNVLSSISAQAASTSGVNLDEELANLTTIQNAYGASARVLTTVNAMFDSLFAVTQ